MAEEKSNVDNFLQSVCRFVSTEERAQDIKDELRDHIDSYIDEYTDDGLNIEDATSKALKQMGDPYSLSNNFKENISNNKRIFIASLTVSFMLIIASVNMYGYINNLYTFSDIFMNLVFLIFNIPIVVLLLKTHTKSKKLNKSNPVFYIQSYKTSTWYENMLKPIKWLFIFSFVINLIPDFNSFDLLPKNGIPFEYLNIITILAMDIIMIVVFYTASPKSQNNIIYPEGILTFESFIPWNKISGYRWVKEHSKNKAIYSIELKFKKKPSSYKYSFRSQLIKVSSSQINLIDEVFKSNGIEQRKCF